MNLTENKAYRLMKLSEVIGNRKKGIPGILPMSRSGWYQGIKDGRFPAPIKLGPNSVAWDSRDIQDLLDRLILESKTNTIKAA